MAAVVVKIGADASELDRALQKARGSAKETAKAISADARAEAKKREQDAKREEREKQAAAKKTAAEAAKVERDKTKAAEREEKARKQTALRARAELHRDAEKKLQEWERLQKRATQIVDREARAQYHSREKLTKDLERLDQRLAASAARSARQTAAARRSAELRTAQDAARTRAGRRATLGNVATGVGTVVGVMGGVALNALGQYGDNAREAASAYRGVELSSAQIAADAGAPQATSQILGAIQRTSTTTGLRPEDIAAALADAQTKFSALGSDSGRASYLSEGGTLDQLARAAIASNTPLADMVATVGELKEQFGLLDDQIMPTVARMIQVGREGRIGFNDLAHSMGELGGMSRRMLGGGGDSVNTVNTLFQFAGRAGLQGGEAATSTEAFFANMTSARGHERLQEVLGHGAFTSTGQLATRRGENQSDAFARMIEQVYARTHGNSTRFLEATAGHRQEAMALSDQLFKDLRENGGHLTRFRGMLGAGRGVDPNAVIGNAYRHISSQEAFRISKQENATMWREAAGAGFANRTDDAMRDLRARHPVVASVVNNAAGKYVFDTMHLMGSQAAVPRQIATRGDLVRSEAARGANANAGIFASQSDVDADASARERGIMQRDHLTQRDLATRLDDATIAAFQAAMERALSATPITTRQDTMQTVHRENLVQSAAHGAYRER